LSDNHQSQAVISADHPSLSGHFPGNPVVPGVVILEQVANALHAWKPALKISGFPSVKFHHIIRSEEPFDILLSQTKENRYHFECNSAGQLIASGQLTCLRANSAHHE